MTIINSSPYFLSVPTFNDLEVRFNSQVTQTIDSTQIKDNESDTIRVYAEFEYTPGFFIPAPSSLYREAAYVMEFKPTDYSQVGAHNVRI